MAKLEDTGAITTNNQLILAREPSSQGLETKQSKGVKDLTNQICCDFFTLVFLFHYMIWIGTAYSDLDIQQNSSYHISHRLKREDCQIYELKKSHFLHSRWLLPKAEHSTRKYLPIKRIILVQRIVLDFFTQFYTKNQASVWLYCLFREFLTNNGSPSFKDPNASQKFPKIGVFCFAFGIVFSIWQLG